MPTQNLAQSYTNSVTPKAMIDNLVADLGTPPGDSHLFAVKAGRGYRAVYRYRDGIKDQERYRARLVDRARELRKIYWVVDGNLTRELKKKRGVSGGKRRKAPKRRVSGGKRRSGKGRVAKRGGGYWTVIIPPAPYAQATEWHDTSGRAATLSRGAFATKAEATKWAKEHLRGTPYSLRKIGGAGGKRRHSPGTPSRLGALVSDINRLTK